jgi:hypothetical protein
MKPWINRALNMALFWCICGLGGSGLVMKFRLGGEYPYLPSQRIIGLAWSDWATLHLCLGLSMLSLVACHLIMNRQWIYRVAAMRNRRAMVAGFLVGALVLTLPLLIPMS